MLSSLLPDGLGGGLASGTTDVAADSADLGSEIFFNGFFPNLAAFAVLVGAVVEAEKLLAPLPDEGVQADQFSFQLLRVALLAVHLLQYARLL
jgi:hypothetical protein